MDLVEGLNHVVRMGKLSRLRPPHPRTRIQILHLNRFRRPPEQRIVKVTRDTGRREKPDPIPAAGPKPAAAKSKNKATASAKTAAANSTTLNLLVPTQNSTSPIQAISDLDHLPVKHVWSSSRPSPPSERGSSPSGSPEDRYSVCGR